MRVSEDKIVYDVEEKNPVTHEVYMKMRLYGGSFAAALAEAWLLADDDNRAKLEYAFSELFAKYANSFAIRE